MGIGIMEALLLGVDSALIYTFYKHYKHNKLTADIIEVASWKFVFNLIFIRFYNHYLKKKLNYKTVYQTFSTISISILHPMRIYQHSHSYKFHMFMFKYLLNKSLENTMKIF